MSHSARTTRHQFGAGRAMMHRVDAILDHREMRDDVTFFGLGDCDYRIRVPQCCWNQDSVRQSECRGVCVRVQPISEIVDRDDAGAKKRESSGWTFPGENSRPSLAWNGNSNWSQRWPLRWPTWRSEMCRRLGAAIGPRGASTWNSTLRRSISPVSSSSSQALRSSRP